MPAARTPMRQAREILKIENKAGPPVREIVRRTRIPRRTVRELLERCAVWRVAPSLRSSVATFGILADDGRQPMENLVQANVRWDASARSRKHKIGISVSALALSVDVAWRDGRRD